MEHPDVEFEDPPAHSGGRLRIEWEPRLAVARSRPGQWARIGKWGGLSGASTHRRKLVDQPPPGEQWEFRASRNGEGGSNLFARYLGPTNGKEK
jgi:hypothetical protein